MKNIEKKFILVFLLFFYSVKSYSIDLNNYELSHVLVLDNSENNKLISGFSENSINKHLYYKNIFGKISAIYQIESNASLQEMLLEKGYSLFYPELNIDSYWHKKLMDAENKAFINRSGIWNSLEDKIILLSEKCYKDECFLIINGKIDKISLYQSNLYINLNNNRFKKLTIIFSRECIKSWKIAYKNYRQLLGKKIEVRGWYNKEKQTLKPNSCLMLNML